jgi:hypothetical protein
MKLIGHSIGVLMVSGAMVAIAPVSSLAQSAMLSLPGLPDAVLTPAQVEPLDQLDAQARSALQTILTPSQLTQLEAMLRETNGVSRPVITALNLSPAQQIELMQILLSPRQDTADVLTPEQIESARRNLPFHP